MSNDAAAVFNERLLYPSYEIINGTKYRILASTPYYCFVMMNIFCSIFNYCKENKNGHVFFHGAEVKFSEENIFQPDVFFVKKENENIIDWESLIDGVPDMVVEVLSRSTRKRDLTIKKDTYEKYGVKEYWIVDPYTEVIDVYILRTGKYELDFEYICYDENDLEEIADFKDEEKPEIRNEISPSIFPELKINLHNIFDLY